MTGKYSQLFKNWLQRLLAYRVRIIIWLIRDVAMFIIFPFIWLAIYGDRPEIGSFSKANIVTYYVVVAFINTVVTSHIGDVIKKDIVRGELNTLLLRPMPYVFYHSIHEIAYRVYGLLAATLTSSVLLFALPGWISFPTPLNSLFFIISLVLAFVISQTLQTLIGLAAFWLGENSSLNNTTTLLQMICGGEIAPLSFFSPLVQLIAAWLPFKYLIYVPAQIYLNQLSPTEIGRHFLLTAVWIILLSLFTRFCWQRGVRTYDGSGI